MAAPTPRGWWRSCSRPTPISSATRMRSATSGLVGRSANDGENSGVPGARSQQHVRLAATAGGVPRGPGLRKRIRRTRRSWASVTTRSPSPTWAGAAPRDDPVAEAHAVGDRRVGHPEPGSCSLLARRQLRPGPIASGGSATVTIVGTPAPPAPDERCSHLPTGSIPTRQRLVAVQTTVATAPSAPTITAPVSVPRRPTADRHAIRSRAHRHGR
jgi:hypothetical protein